MATGVVCIVYCTLVSTFYILSVVFFLDVLSKYKLSISSIIHVNCIEIIICVLNSNKCIMYTGTD